MVRQIERLWRSALIASLLAVSTSGLSAQSATLSPEERCAGRPTSVVGTFADPRMEDAIRTSLRVPADTPLTCARLSTVTSVEARGLGIQSLAGIQNLEALRRLNVWENSIADVGPLRGLTALTYLDLGTNEIRDLTPLSGLEALDTLYVNGNGIEDVAPLAGLTGLRFLFIQGNAIRDITSLAGLTQLTNLNITHNSISDISVLTNMRELETLRVYNNPLTDITPMRELPELHELHVHDLPNLTDIRPLLDNPGLGPGDHIIVYNSGASCNDVAALQAKGVPVNSDCWLQELVPVLPGIAAVLFAAAGAFVLIRRGRRRKNFSTSG
jgi:hypothetical protein